MTEKKVLFLDCTLRDGGQGLEYAYNHGITKEFFTRGNYENILKAICSSKVELFELGTIDPSATDCEKFAIYKDLEEISTNLKILKSSQEKAVVLYKGPDTPLDKISDFKEGLCQNIRVILRYSELAKSLDFCEGLARKGYRVFVQPMLTMRYTNDELKYVAERAAKMGAFALYMVDSYGYMDGDDISRIFKIYDAILPTEISVGFHAHNNLNNAFSNAKYFKDLETRRGKIIDCCVAGMGQGAGNLQSELALSMLCTGEEQYDVASLFDAYEEMEKFNGSGLWGYGIEFAIPALCRAAYKYTHELRVKHHLKYKEIYQILMSAPADVKNRFCAENLNKLLKRRLSTLAG